MYEQRRVSAPWVLKRSSQISSLPRITSDRRRGSSAHGVEVGSRHRGLHGFATLHIHTRNVAHGTRELIIVTASLHASDRTIDWGLGSITIRHCMGHIRRLTVHIPWSSIGNCAVTAYAIVEVGRLLHSRRSPVGRILRIIGLSLSSCSGRSAPGRWRVTRRTAHVRVDIVSISSQCADTWSCVAVRRAVILIGAAVVCVLSIVLMISFFVAVMLRGMLRRQDAIGSLMIMIGRRSGSGGTTRGRAHVVLGVGIAVPVHAILRAVRRWRIRRLLGWRVAVQLTGAVEALSSGVVWLHRTRGRRSWGSWH